MTSPFASGWWSFDLEPYRPCSGTYEMYPYESVPPIDDRRFDGSFAWLEESARSAPAPTGSLGFSDEYFARIEADAKRARVELPPSLLRFLRDPRLGWAVPSCTACEWDPGEHLHPSKAAEGAHTLRVLRDQQDCLFWYLFLTPDGTAEVVCSLLSFDDPDAPLDRDEILASTVRVAPDFESFVHRFWLENTIWFELEKKAPRLSPEQQAYVEHYKRA